MRILVAEPNLLLLAQIEDALKQAGYDVIKCSDGMGAWTVLNDAAPDLLVTCIDLGKGTPPGTALGLRAYSFQPPIPVIYTPASVDDAAHAENEHGHVLVKPFPVSELVATVGHLLNL